MEVPAVEVISSSLEGLSAESSTGSNEVVNTTAALAKVLESLDGLPTSPPSLYIDLEGEYLSRHGNVSILQLHVLPSNQTHLIDIKVLGRDAFTTIGTHGRTLKAVLESEHIPKVFFDVRNDSDALYSHFGIKLAGVQDLQLMQLATRERGRRSYLYGLGKCIEQDCPLTVGEKILWKVAKEKGVRLFAPEHGGSYQVFNERPLKKEIIQYCVQDAKYLPLLWEYYSKRLTSAWMARVCEEAKNRVAESQTKDFNGKGGHMALAPAVWQWI
ncbi:hypothetical protein SLS62_000384 [Diatrype stigma]|uniref:3'-5' exonuclease domain-containing protein n=1 Tax=Diatrype stigma TaxID=117547 RepID=A0AAN9V2S6_9PEZI